MRSCWSYWERAVRTRSTRCVRLCVCGSIPCRVPNPASRDASTLGHPLSSTHQFGFHLGFGASWRGRRWSARKIVGPAHLIFAGRKHTGVWLFSKPV